MFLLYHEFNPRSQNIASGDGWRAQHPDIEIGMPSIEAGLEAGQRGKIGDSTQVSGPGPAPSAKPAPGKVPPCPAWLAKQIHGRHRSPNLLEIELCLGEQAGEVPAPFRTGESSPAPPELLSMKRGTRLSRSTRSVSGFFFQEILHLP